jgi:CRISPR/Cas system-associated exonuclease Cas4 (RecB family)
MAQQSLPFPGLLESPKIKIFQSASALERLAAARKFVQSYKPGTELLLLGATREAVDDFATEICAAAGATFGLHRFTLMQLVARLAAVELALTGQAPATALAAEAVAARATFEALEQNAIRYFRPVARHPGFAPALADTLKELRLAAIDPAKAETLGDAGQDIATLFQIFNQQLEKAAVTDRAALIQIATRAVRSRPHASWIAQPLLLLDVPFQSPCEGDFLKVLAELSPALFATVPAGDQETMDVLEGLGSIEHVQPTGSKRQRSNLARLQTYLFSDEAPPAEEGDGAVRFFSAPGESRECVEISRQILDEARRGISFDDIAVYLRTPEVYSPLLETAFRRAGIPGFFARGTKRPDPSGRAFLALLACKSERLSAKRFAEYLSFGQVPPLDVGGAPPAAREVWSGPEDDTLGPAGEPGRFAGQAKPPEPDLKGAAEDEQVPAFAGSLRTPWKWEEFIVEAAVIGGKDRWSRRLDGLERELRLKLQELTNDDPDSPRLTSLQRDVANLAHLRSFALPVIETIDALPSSASWGDWLQQLRLLAPRVLRRPERVLAVLAELEPMAAIGPVSIDEVRDVLAQRLSTLEEEPPLRRYGRVFVATPAQARGRSFKTVFIPGLAERIFPQRPREDPLLLDYQRHGLSADLRTQADRGQQERMLLRLAVGSAQERVYISYPRLNVVEARPRVTSFYGLDVARAIRGHIPDFEKLEQEAADAVKARLAWPAPPDPDRAIDSVEHDLAILGPLLRESDSSKVRGRARYLLELNENLARSLRSRWARWHNKSWSQFDGLVRTTAAIMPALAEHRLCARPYSVSALQKFAACPYQFLLSAIYRLEPRKEIAALEQLDPLTRGHMFHRVQAEGLRVLARNGDLPVTPKNLDNATAVFDQTLDRVGAEYREELAPPILRVWLNEIEAMRADLRGWLRHVAASGDTWLPAYFEFSFGLPADPSRDPASLAQPVTLDGGWKLRGSIDLIERNQNAPVLRVTDHKTGADRTGGTFIVGGGEILQPILYSLVVEAAMQQRVAEARLFFCTAHGAFAERVLPLNDLIRQQGIDVLEIVDRAVEKGILPPAPRKGACLFCDFRVVCGPYEEIRSSRKNPQLLIDLGRLRQRV